MEYSIALIAKSGSADALVTSTVVAMEGCLAIIHNGKTGER